MINTQVNVFSNTTSIQTVTQTEYIISTRNFELSHEKMIFLLVKFGCLLLAELCGQHMHGLIVLNILPFVNQDTQKILAKFFNPKNQGMENFQPPKGLEQIVCYGAQQLSEVSIMVGKFAVSVFCKKLESGKVWCCFLLQLISLTSGQQLQGRAFFRLNT